MPLKFGDLTAKSAATETAKQRITEYPPVIQRLGLDACREAAARIRKKAAGR